MGESLKEFSFERLTVYQKAQNFAKFVYSFTKHFPKEELFGLNGQLRRAAVSISLNIAEGSSRSNKEFSRFLEIAKGSVFECIAIIEIAAEEKYISREHYNQSRLSLEELSKMLSGLKKSLMIQDS